MLAIFVDTSAWLAVMLKNDKNHAVAVQYLKSARQARYPFVTTDYVLDETYTRLRYDAGIAAALQARKLMEEAQKARSLHVEWITPALTDKAWEYLEKYADHNFSFTDCTSFAVCETLRLKEAFCFDCHFSVAGLSVVPVAGGEQDQ